MTIDNRQYSDLLFCDIFALQKVLFLKTSDDVIACDLWLGPPPQSKILATPMIPPLWISNDKAYLPPYPDDKRCLNAAKMIKVPGTYREINDIKEWSKSGKLQP